MGLRVWENEFEIEFEGGARKGDGCGWPMDRCECDARREGGGCVLGVMLGAMGVVEVWDMLWMGV